MIKAKQILRWTPEIILILETAFYWISSSPFNPIAMTLLLILTSQFIFKNKTVGLIISVFFILINLFMSLALISELREFPSWTSEAKLMMLVGAAMFGIGVTASIFMFTKWIKKPEDNTNYAV